MTVAIETNPLDSLQAELRRREEAKRDLIADTRRVSLAVADPYYGNAGPELPPKLPMRLDLNVDLPDGAEAFKINPHAHRQIAEHLDISWKVYDRLLNGVEPDGKRRKKKAAHPDLLADLANGLLSREPSKQMLRTLDGNVRAFLSNRYRPRDNWDLMNEAVMPVLREHGQSFEVKQAALTETRMYVKLFMSTIVVPITPKVGDVIRGGAIISNSEVGSGSLYIYPYTDRLICTNGMVHTEYGQRRVHVGARITQGNGDSGEGPEAWELYSDETLRLDDEAFFAKTRDTLRAVLDETVFQAIAADMRELADIRLPNVVDAVEVVAKRHSLSEKEQNGVWTAMIEGHDPSAWGLVNAITRTARDMEDADRQTELETLAGSLVSERKWAADLAVATV